MIFSSKHEEAALTTISSRKYQVDVSLILIVYTSFDYSIFLVEDPRT